LIQSSEYPGSKCSAAPSTPPSAPPALNPEAPAPYGALPSHGETPATHQPAAPLRPAALYRLRVDGAASRELHAADGTLRGPVELHLVAAGAPAEARPGPRSAKKRRP